MYMVDGANHESQVSSEANMSSSVSTCTLNDALMQGRYHELAHAH